MNVTPVLLVGESGTGKSTTFETLPPDRTLVLNTENKSLPFTNADHFAQVRIETYQELDQYLNMCLTPEGEAAYDYIVLDSFTSATEIINRYAEFAFRGYDQWKNYNAIIVDVIIKLKKMKQQVFIVAIPEQKDIGFNEYKSYARIKGKELKFGHLEKEMAIVLFTNPIYEMESGEMEGVEMLYKSNKNTTSKCPNGMFDKRPPNDALFISNAIKAYYGRSH